MAKSLTLADIGALKTSGRFIRLRAQRALNLGNPIIRTSMDVNTFLAQSVVGNDPLKGEITQRKLDPQHAAKLTRYILKAVLDYTIKMYKADGRTIPAQVQTLSGALGTQHYYSLAPFIVTLREDDRSITIEAVNDDNLEEIILNLRANQLLFIDDGQHRGDAYGQVFVILKTIKDDRKYPRAGGLFPPELKTVNDDAVQFWLEAMVYFRERFSVSLDIHCGLSIEQERQLFHDTNNLQKTVSPGLAEQFDSGNPVNLFTDDLINWLETEEGLKIGTAEKVDWTNNADHYMGRHNLTAVNSRLLVNDSKKKATPLVINPRVEDAWDFWRAIAKIPNYADRDQSVVAQPALLKSLARLFYDLSWGTQSDDGLAKTFLDVLPKLDFSHSNQLWNITHMENEAAELEKTNTLGLKLLDYLNLRWKEKEIAESRNGLVRFGTRHNESILVLPHVIRFLANLPVSPLVKAEKEKARNAAKAATG